MMLQRALGENIIAKLDKFPAVAILGPRQVGKTTLALEISAQMPSVYLDLESEEDIQKLQNVRHYCDLHKDRLIILDEVQLYPDLFKSLRGVIDAFKREGKKTGSFLLLGSASNELLQQSSESLAGRISYTELYGVQVDEISTNKQISMQQLWLRGGFPDSLNALSELDSFDWRTNFIRTYLERDIPMLGPRIPAATLKRFWTMLAHIQGEPFNAAKIASSLGVDATTVARYLDLMVDLLLVRKLEPWSGNTKKRLVKSPRVYVRDSGLVHNLLQIKDYEALLGNPIYGKSWEGFIIESILSRLPEHCSASFYRTSAGAEIDLLIEFGAEKYWAIEIKSSHAPKVKKGFHIACDDLGAQRKFVIYPGDDNFPMNNDVECYSLSSFLQELKKLS